MGNKSLNLAYSPSLQSVVAYNFTEIQSTFPVPFWDKVAHWAHDGSVAWFPFVWWGKVNRTDSSTKDFSLIGSFFFYICCNLSVVQNIPPWQEIFYSKIYFLIFYIPLVLKHLRIFVTMMQSNFAAFYLKLSRRVT